MDWSGCAGGVRILANALVEQGDKLALQREYGRLQESGKFSFSPACRKRRYLTPR